jgi:cadmium resistance protein CadD (predicted permease)
MERIIATVATAAALFAGTNIDDMVVLAVLNVSSRVDGRPRAWQIWAGQYAGIATLTVISLLAALGLRVVSERWIWLLGLVPLCLGVRKLFIAVRARSKGEQVSPAVAGGLTGVIALTIANGGDNIATYSPVFRTINAADTALTIIVFAVGVALWCIAGSWLVSHHKITQVIQHWGQWIVPAVFILIGLYIFQRAGVFGV